MTALSMDQDIDVTLGSGSRESVDVSAFKSGGGRDGRTRRTCARLGGVFGRRGFCPTQALTARP